MILLTRLIIYKIYRTDIFCNFVLTAFHSCFVSYHIYYFFFQRMPPKTRKSTSSTTVFPAGKESRLPETISIITPATSPTKKQRKSDFPKKATVDRKKAPKNSKQSPKGNTIIHAVINLKSGGAKIFKTNKAATDYLTDQQNCFGIGMIKDLKHFVCENKQAFQDTCNHYKTSQADGFMISPQASIADVLPNSKDTLANQDVKIHPLVQALSTEFMPTKLPVVKIKIENPEITEVPATNPTSNPKSNFFPNLPPGLTVESNPTVVTQGNSHMLADNLKTYHNASGCTFQLTLLPEKLCLSDNQSYQVFAIDLVENRSNNTLWTHKPSAWEQVFNMDRTLSQGDGGHNIDEFFYNLRSTFRRNIPKGPNMKKTLITKNSRVVDCQILWGMVVCTDNTEDMLTTEIAKFLDLARNQAIQQAYYVTMQNLGSTFKPLLDQIMPPATKGAPPRVGEYWEKLSTVCSHEIQVIHCQSMNEIFLDDVINTVIAVIWNTDRALSPNMWSADMNMFAFGRA